MLVLSVGNPNGKSYRFDIAPADYYKATCMIELEFGGAWYVVTGRQIPRSTRIRMSNGLLRFTTGNSSTEATLEAWNGSQWVSSDISLTWAGTTTLRRIGRYTPGSFSSSARDIQVTVLRNSPEQITARMSTFSDQLTFSMLRGSRHFTADWSMSLNADIVGIGLTNGAAGTAITGGVIKTANTNLVFPIFAGAAARTADTTNTRTRNTTGALSDTLFAGFTIVGDTYLNTDSAIVQQMMSGVNWRQRVVAR
jgi:hypothetical protein